MQGSLLSELRAGSLAFIYEAVGTYEVVDTRLRSLHSSYEL